MRFEILFFFVMAAFAWFCANTQSTSPSPRVKCIDVSPDGNMISVCYWYGMVQVIHVNARERIIVSRGEDSTSSWSGKFHPTRAMLLYAQDEKAMAFDFESKKSQVVISFKPTETINSFEFIDDDVLAIGTTLGISLVSSKEKKVIKTHSVASGVYSSAVDKKSSRIIFGCGNGAIVSAGMKDLSGQITLKAHTGCVWQIRITGSDGFLSASSDGTLVYWDHVGQNSRLVRSSDRPILAMAYNEKTKFVFSAGIDGVIYASHLENNKLSYFKKCSSDTISSIILSKQNGDSLYFSGNKSRIGELNLKSLVVTPDIER